MLQRLFFLFFLLPCLINALDIKGSIVPNVHLPSTAALPPSTLLILTSADLLYKTHPSSSGSFTFHNVTVGPSYLLQVESLTHSFPRLRIETQGAEVKVYQTVQGNSWSTRGIQLFYPIQLSASSRADYYLPRSGFKIDSVLKNPMILLAMFSMAVMFVIPKMTAGLDQQALEEYRAQQPAAPQLPSFDFASFMAGSGSKKPAAVEQSRKSK